MREILYFCLLVVLILMICLLRLLVLYGRLRGQQENLTESFYQLQKMNATLRSQRHDYLNHLHVVQIVMTLPAPSLIHFLKLIKAFRQAFMLSAESPV